MSYLVATDGSAISDEAVKRATQQAQAFDQPLAIVHVLTPETELVDGEIVMPGDDTAIESGRQVLQQAVGMAADIDSSVDVTTELLTGRPADAITEHAGSTDADAIFIGHRGLSSAREQVVGSVAKSVLDKADRPVMIVR